MRNKSAMSMVEIMIGVVLLALIIIPSLNVISTQTKTVTSTRDHSQAAFVAATIRETLRSYRFAMIESDQYSSDTTTQRKTFEWKLKNSDELRKHTINNIQYLVDPDSVKIDPVLKTSGSTGQKPAAYLVQYSINYRSKDNRNHRLDISTAIAQRD